MLPSDQPAQIIGTLAQAVELLEDAAEFLLMLGDPAGGVKSFRCGQERRSDRLGRPEIRDWLEANPLVQVHFTPTSALVDESGRGLVRDHRTLSPSTAAPSAR